MWSKFTHQETRYAGMALSVLLTAALSFPAHAAEIWRINHAKSQFGPDANTLVLERASAKAPSQGTDATADQGTFLVISNGNVYMATDETAYDPSAGTGVKKVDYARWNDMKLVQIGEKVRSTEHCAFACQSGLPDKRMTLTFHAKGGDPSAQMGNILVLNTR
jgi:hypothetical protein